MLNLFNNKNETRDKINSLVPEELTTVIMSEKITPYLATTYKVELPKESSYNQKVAHNRHCDFYVRGTTLIIETTDDIPQGELVLTVGAYHNIYGSYTVIIKCKMEKE